MNNSRKRNAILFLGFAITFILGMAAGFVSALIFARPIIINLDDQTPNEEVQPVEESPIDKETEEETKTPEPENKVDDPGVTTTSSTGQKTFKNKHISFNFNETLGDVKVSTSEAVSDCGFPVVILGFTSSDIKLYSGICGRGGGGYIDTEIKKVQVTNPNAGNLEIKINNREYLNGDEKIHLSVYNSTYKNGFEIEADGKYSETEYNKIAEEIKTIASSLVIN